MNIVSVSCKLPGGTKALKHKSPRRRQSYRLQLLVARATRRIQQDNSDHRQHGNTQPLPNHVSSWDRAAGDAHCGWIAPNVVKDGSKSNSREWPAHPFIASATTLTKSRMSSAVVSNE